MNLIPWRHRINVRPHVPSTLGSDPLRSEMDRMLEQFFGEPLAFDLAGVAAGAWTMPVDVSETAEAYLVRAELPGLDPKDVEITLSEGVLTIQGEKRAETQSENEGRHVSERRFGAFRRSFVLPSAVDESKVVARHENGVLRVELAKLAPVKPRKIEIKAS
ncbi:MAG: Hsp20/alpha crystallin family protein [Planctomycetes bacterium]|nr:Hsp20/alpha crystallin family protein [Planctomycetota bacterium]